MSSTPYIQNFFTSRDNNANAETYVGQEGRLWWDPISNQIYSSNGNTPGGIPLAGGGGSSNKIYNGSSYANIASVSGNLVIGISGNTWNFDTAGTLTLPYGAVLRDSAISTLTLGNGAGNIGNVQDGAIAIGWLTGTGGQGYDAVAIGSSAASDGFQGESAVAIGSSAGGDTQSPYAVAVGTTAGQFSQGTSAVAVGTQAGGNTQGIGAVAVGPGAGYQHQSNSAVAIGLSAGSNTQGIYAVAIGTFAGANNQANNSIVINATGVDLDNTTANSFVVAPVRNVSSANVVQYNAATNEVSYSNTVSISGNIAGGNILTGGLVSATGNIAGNYFIGNGSALTGITVGAGSQIINGTSNVTVASGANVTVGIAGTTIATYASTGEYITGIISASGNIVSAGNVTGGNILTTGLISAAGNIAGNYFIGNGSQLTGIASGGGASDARVMGYNLVFGG